MTQRVAAIVVTYNRKTFLTRCIAALQQQAEVQPDILIIDNASTDGTGNAVAALPTDERLHYYNTGENLGGAGGFNYGMKLAAQLGYDYLWVMDDDCIPEPGALSALLEADRVMEGEYGFLSGIAYWRDGSLCNMNIQKTGLMTKLTRLDAPYVPVIMATFVSAFFPVRRVREVGLPIKEFFIWSDDLEYTRRLSRRYPCYAVTGCRVLHDMHSNNKVNIVTDTPERIPRYRLLYRNEVYVYRREGLLGWLYLIARVGYHVLRALCARGQRLERARVILSSFMEGVRFHPPVEYLTETKEP